jgi:hypothetical protein
MAKIQIIPLDTSTLDRDDLVIANLATQSRTPDSMWRYSNGDLIVENTIPCRAGVFTARSVLLDSDTSDDTLISDQSRIDLVATPSTYYPDIYWASNGLDLIPRGD